jgi:putative transposase
MSRPRGPEPRRLHLSESQRRILEEIVNCRHSPQYEALRAQIILGADLGRRNQHIALKLGICVQTAGLWRTRWANAAEQLREVESESDEKVLRSSIKAVLNDASRTGCPPTFTPEQICRIIALACESPADLGRPVSHWSARELADEAVKQGIFSKISPRSAGRFLKSGGSKASQVPILAEQRKR